MSDERNEKLPGDLSEAERNEVLMIRSHYEKNMTKEEGMEEIRRIELKKKKGVILPTVFLAVAGTLVFGTGLSMVLEWNILIWGSLVALCGIGILIACYPIHNAIEKHYREKYRDEVLSITNELLKEKTDD